MANTFKVTPKQQAIRKLVDEREVLLEALWEQRAPLVRAITEKLVSGEDHDKEVEALEAAATTTPEIEAVEAQIRALDPASMLLPENADEYNY